MIFLLYCATHGGLFPNPGTPCDEWSLNFDKMCMTDILGGKHIQWGAPLSELVTFSSV